MISYVLRHGPPEFIERRLERFLREPPSVRNAVGVIVIATLAVVGAGVAISLIDNEEYSSVGIGMWWALQTVTTVGYGDVTPTNFSWQARGAAVMLEGTAFIAIVTAVITSTFAARATRESEAARLKDELSDRELTKGADEFERKLEPWRPGVSIQGLICSQWRRKRVARQPAVSPAGLALPNVALTTAAATTRRLIRKRPTSSAAATPSAP